MPVLEAQAQSGPNGEGVQQCAEGHALQNSTAESGRCEGCSRWIFGNEKVMSCRSCSTYYCSTCEPQVRSSGEDRLWEDMLSMVGGALRDVERIKDHLVTECDVDLERIRSAFNCQEPGVATLSAEQIVVEHAVEQVRATLNCANPDISNLHDHEEVIGRNPRPPPTPPTEEEQETASAEKRDDGFAGDDETPAESAFKKPVAHEPAADLLDLQAKAQEPSAAEQQMPVAQPPRDLLDLSATVKELPAAKEQVLVDLLDLSLGEGAANTPVEQAPVDLLDAEFASEEFTPFVSASFPEKPPMDLMDMVAEMQTPTKSVPEESAIIANAADKTSPEKTLLTTDIFDLSASDNSKVTVEMSHTEPESLLHLSGSLVAPEATQPVVQAGLPKVMAGPVDLL